MCGFELIVVSPRHPATPTPLTVRRRRRTVTIKGLKSVYGLDLDAIGCRNEKGVSVDFVKKFRATLNANGLEKVPIHGFDNWDKAKFDFARRMTNDLELRNAVAIISAHTMATAPTPLTC